MKLKKQMITINLEKVRAAHGTTLQELSSLYTKLAAKYGTRKSLRIIEKYESYRTYRTQHWLIERRMETDAELAKRQAKHDAVIARKKAVAMRRRAARKAETARYRAEAKAREAAHKKAQMEKKIEEIKTMAKLLKAAGIKITPGQVKIATARG